MAVVPLFQFSSGQISSQPCRLNNFVSKALDSPFLKVKYVNKSQQKRSGNHQHPQLEIQLPNFDLEVQPQQWPKLERA
jgi:hypothetical protein